MSDRGIKRRAGTSNKHISRVLRKREPKIEEDVKNAMFIHGPHSSATLNELMVDLHRLKSPDAVTYNRKNKIYPFEDQTSIEFFASKHDSALFAYSSHSKKRPNNLILGRLFDQHVLDMVELGVEEYIGMEAFQSSDNASTGSKPAFLFNGALFETNEDYKSFANIIVDFFRGTVIDKINLFGNNHIIACSAIDDKIHMHHYNVKLLSSGTKTPRIELEEAGPEMVLILRRTRLASADLRKEAMRKPSQLRAHAEKNLSTDAFGQQRGRVHMQRQDLNTMATRRFKGLRKSRDSEGGAESAKPAKKQRAEEDSK